MLNQLQDRTHIAINQVTEEHLHRQAVKVSGAADGVSDEEHPITLRHSAIQQAHSITLFYVRNSNAIYFNTNCTLLVIFNFKVD